MLNTFNLFQFSADCTNETPPDYETSVGGPPTNPISAASEITVNESSVVLDPVGRVIDLHQLHHYQETTSQAGQSHIIASCTSTGYTCYIALPTCQCGKVLA